MVKDSKIITNFISFALMNSRRGLLFFQFKDKVTEMYSQYLRLNVRKPLDLQTFQKYDPKKVVYYSTDTSAACSKNPDPVSWVAANDEGVFFSEKNTINISPKLTPKNNHKFSWSYRQQLDCLPTYGRGVKTIIPKLLQNKYPNNACCIRINTMWVKRPVIDIICSKQKNIKICTAEILILRATLYEKCMKNSIKEMNQMLKNKKIKIPKNQNQKVFNTLKRLKKFLKGKKLPKDLLNKVKKIKKAKKNLMKKLKKPKKKCKGRLCKQKPKKKA